MLLHVNARSHRTSQAEPQVLEKLRALAAAHAGLPRPSAAGRAVGQKRG